MQQVITAKLKLLTTPEQFQALRESQLVYRDALNAVSRYAFEQGKTSSTTTLHRGMYAELRTRYHLPSQLACSVERLSLMSDLDLIRIKAQRLVVGGQCFLGSSQFSQNHSPIAVGLYMRRVKSERLLKGHEGFLPSSQVGQSQTLIMSNLSILGKSRVKL